MKILLIDFYDSFTYNLKHYLESFDHIVVVIRHDEIADLITINEYSHVVLSPGPGLPDEKINMREIITFCDSRIHLLGICLGMQGIGQYLGGSLNNLEKVKHGVSVRIDVKRKSHLYDGVPDRFNGGLYHSWALSDVALEYIDAVTPDGIVMGISCESRKVYGVQFHPESILTPCGKKLLNNFIDLE
jgi:anthranilate synthase component 2